MAQIVHNPMKMIAFDPQFASSQAYYLCIHHNPDY